MGNLRDSLAELFPAVEVTRMIVDDAQLRSAGISFDARATVNWYSILTEALAQDKLEQLLRVVESRYPDNTRLNVACEELRAEIASRSEHPHYLPASSGAIPFFWSKDSIPAVDLVGRNVEVVETLEVLRRGEMLLVHGEPGVGKSSFLLGVLSHLDVEWVLVCSGRRLLTVQNLFHGVATAIGREAPFDTQVGADEPIDLQFLLRWVAQGATRQGLGVLAIDDLHLFDDVSQTIESLLWLKQICPNLKVVLVSASANERIRPQSHVQLKPLTPELCERLVENETQTSAAGCGGRIWRATGGIPARLLDLCRVVREFASSGSEEEVVDEALRVYESDPSGRRYFRDHWWSRIDSNGRICLALLAGIKEIPADATTRREFLKLSENMGVTDPSRTLDVLVDLGLVRLASTLSVTQGYRQIIEEIAQDEWGAPRTREIYEAEGDFLQRRRRYPEAIGAFVKAENYARALETASHYNEVIKSGGWSPLVAQSLRLVLEDRTVNDAHVILAHQLLAEDAYLRGDCDAALDHLEGALEYSNPVSTDRLTEGIREARLRRRRAKLYVYMGRSDAAVEEYERALASVHESEDPESLSTWARIISSRAAIDSLRGEFQTAIAACRDASGRLERVRQRRSGRMSWDPVEVALATAQAWLWADEGRAWQRQGFLSEAYRLSGLAYAEFHRIPYAYGEALSGMNLAHTFLKAGCPRLARLTLEAAREMGERTSSTLVQVEARILLVKILIHADQWVDARRALDEILLEPTSTFARYEAVNVDILRAQVRHYFKGPNSITESRQLFASAFESLAFQERIPELIALLESSVPGHLTREERTRMAQAYRSKLSPMPIDTDQERSWLMLSEFAEQNDVSPQFVRRLWNRHYLERLRPEYANAARRVRLVHTEDWRRWYAEMKAV